MSRTFSVSLNRSEKLIVLNKFKIDESEIGKLTKTLLLQPDTAFHPENYNQVKKFEKKELEEKTFSEVENEIEVMTLSQLKKELGIGTRNKANKVDQKGFYFQPNLQARLKKFLEGWNGEYEIAIELVSQLSMMVKEEILTREYVRRSR